GGGGVTGAGGVGVGGGAVGGGGSGALATAGGAGAGRGGGAGAERAGGAGRARLGGGGGGSRGTRRGPGSAGGSSTMRGVREGGGAWDASRVSHTSIPRPATRCRISETQTRRARVGRRRRRQKRTSERRTAMGPRTIMPPAAHRPHVRLDPRISAHPPEESGSADAPPEFVPRSPPSPAGVPPGPIRRADAIYANPVGPFLGGHASRDGFQSPAHHPHLRQRARVGDRR